MDVTATLVFGVFVLFVFLFFRGKDEGALPGPAGLPIVGYLPFITTKPYIKLQNLAKTYGPVYSVQLGSRKCIVLNDFECTRDAFAKDVFIGRPPMLPFDLTKETIETGAFYGLPSKDQRRLSVQLLKHVGFGTSHTEDIIKGEIQGLWKQLEESKGCPIYIKSLLAPCLSNNLSTLLFGKKLDDPIRVRLDEIVAAGTAAAGQVAWQIFFPWGAKLTKAMGFGRHLNSMFDEARKLTKGLITAHQEALDENNIKDYVDGYLVEIRKKENPAFSTSVLEDLLFIIYTAGVETARVTMEWSLLAMAAYPEVQKKVHEEIDTAIGSFRTPSYKDHTNMPYTQATIMEIMRWRTALPINALRCTLWDTELNGFFIPKGSYILPNAWAIHHNPKYWGEDAESFRPERFLTEDHRDVIKSDYLIPFSTGKRSCPGESYSRMIVFLYFTFILQKFKVCLPEGAVPNFDGNLGITLRPKPQKLCIRKRS